MYYNMSLISQFYFESVNIILIKSLNEVLD